MVGGWLNGARVSFPAHENPARVEVKLPTSIQRRGPSTCRPHRRRRVAPPAGGPAAGRRLNWLAYDAATSTSECAALGSLVTTAIAVPGLPWLLGVPVWLGAA